MRNDPERRAPPLLVLCDSQLTWDQTCTGRSVWVSVICQCDTLLILSLSHKKPKVYQTGPSSVEMLNAKSWWIQVISLIILQMMIYFSKRFLQRLNGFPNLKMKFIEINVNRTVLGTSISLSVGERGAGLETSLKKDCLHHDKWYASLMHSPTGSLRCVSCFSPMSLFFWSVKLLLMLLAKLFPCLVV